LAASEATWYPSDAAAATTAELNAGHAAITTGAKIQTAPIKPYKFFCTRN
jgi:hypothetical protein